MGPEICREVASGFLCGHAGLRPLINDATTTKEGTPKTMEGTCMENYRNLWKTVSEPDVVSKNEGWATRRILLGAICGVSTTHVEALEFVGGQQSAGTFAGAKSRRLEADDRHDIKLL